MNLLEGSLCQGEFVSGKMSIAVASTVNEDSATLGVRPEDCQVVAHEAGQLAGTIYATELLGDYTLVSATVGDTLVTVKAAKEFEGAFDSSVSIAIESSAIYLFDKSGERLRFD